MSLNELKWVVIENEFFVLVCIIVPPRLIVAVLWKFDFISVCLHFCCGYGPYDPLGLRSLWDWLFVTQDGPQKTLVVEFKSVLAELNAHHLQVFYELIGVNNLACGNSEPRTISMYLLRPAIPSNNILLEDGCS
jgi:hypothetical protein